MSVAVLWRHLYCKIGPKFGISLPSPHSSNILQIFGDKRSLRGQFVREDTLKTSWKGLDGYLDIVFPPPCIGATLVPITQILPVCLAFVLWQLSRKGLIDQWCQRWRPWLNGSGLSNDEIFL
jgi:hypothetical protein